MNKNDDNNYLNKLINNHYTFDNNLINNDNIINEMHEKQNENLDYFEKDKKIMNKIK